MMIRRGMCLFVWCLLAAPAAAASIVDEADDAFSSRNWEEAAELYERARAEGKLEGEAHHRAMYRQGEALRRAERYAEAAVLLRRVLEADDAEPRMRLDAGRRLGIALRRDDRLEEAVDALREALALELPPNANTRFGDTALLAGDILALDLGQYDDAIEMYRKVERTSEYVGRGPGWARISDAGGRISYAEALRDEPTAFWIGPFTTHVHHDRAQVYWVSGEEDPAGVLTLGHEPGDDAAGEHAPEVEPMRHVEGYNLQVVRLEDLAPGTEYHYAIQTGEETAAGRFRTAPEPGSRERITFAVYGDTQDRPEFHRETAPAIAESEPDFVLHTGDMVGSGDYWPHWKAQYFDPARDMLRQTVLWPSVGNHDGFQYYDQFFAQDTGIFHSFTHGNIAVFIVASYRGGGVRDEQIAWIEEALAESEADWTFVVTHYPMISVGTSHWVNWGQDDYLPIFQAQDLDFVLTGHEHVYRRFLPIGDEGKNPVFHITSGGGASVLGDRGRDGEGVPYAPSPLTPEAVWALHFLHFEIEGERLTMEARLRDGTILDRIELTKHGGRYSDDVLDETVTFEDALRKVRAYVALQEDTGRRSHREAPAAFEPTSSEADEDASRTFEVRFENTLPEDAGRMRVAPAEETQWTFEPTVFAAGEPIAFEVEAPEPVDSPRDLPLAVDLALLRDDDRELVPETYRIVPTDH